MSTQKTYDETQKNLNFPSPAKKFQPLTSQLTNFTIKNTPGISHEFGMKPAIETWVIS